jgi:hypothetical protein
LSEGVSFQPFVSTFPPLGYVGPISKGGEERMEELSKPIENLPYT